MYKPAVIGMRAHCRLIGSEVVCFFVFLAPLWSRAKTQRHVTFDRILFCFFGTVKYLKMKHIANSQSSQPSAFMNHLMMLSNQTQVQTIFWNIRNLCFYKKKTKTNHNEMLCPSISSVPPCQLFNQKISMLLFAKERKGRGEGGLHNFHSIQVNCSTENTFIQIFKK